MGDDRKFEILITGNASSVVTAAKESESALQKMAGSMQSRFAGVQKEVTDGVINVSEAEAKAALESMAGDTKLTASKHQLKEMVRGLRDEFPLLARFAHLAISGPALAVAGITAGFALWKSRVDTLTQALGGVEMPDMTIEKIKRVNLMAEAWSNVAKAVTDANKAFNSVDARADRQAKTNEENQKHAKRLRDSMKARQLSELETARANGMPEGDYLKHKFGIEQAYESADLNAEEDAKENAEKEKRRKIVNLRTSGQGKMDEAGKIKVGSADDDAKTLAKMNEAAEKAKADKKAAEDRLESVRTAGLNGSLQANAWYLTHYGVSSREEAAALEQNTIDQQNDIIARARAFERGMPARDKARARRDSLIAEGTGEFGAAAKLELELPGDVAARQADQRNRDQVRVNDYTAKAQTVVATAEKSALDLVKGMTATIESNGGVQMDVLRAMDSFIKAQTEMRKQIANIQSQVH